MEFFKLTLYHQWFAPMILACAQYFIFSQYVCLYTYFSHIYIYKNLDTDDIFVLLYFSQITFIFVKHFHIGFAVNYNHVFFIYRYDTINF